MANVSYETCPTSAPFFGFMGVTAALCFASEETYAVVMMLLKEIADLWIYAMFYSTFYSIVIMYIYVFQLHFI